MALESARRLEQCCQAGGLFHRQRGADRREDPAFLGLSAAASRRHLGRWQWLVPFDRRRPAILLEEQSVSDQSLYGRRRLAAPAMGHDRSGRQDGRQCHQDRLGQPLRHTLLRPVLDGRTGAVLRRDQQGRWQTFPMGAIPDGKGGTPTAQADELEDPGAIPAHLDDAVVQYLRHAWRAGQAQLRGICDQRTLYRNRVSRRPVHRHRQAPAQPRADHYLALLGGPMARRFRPGLWPRRSDRIRLLFQLRRDARVCPP